MSARAAVARLLRAGDPYRGFGRPIGRFFASYSLSVLGSQITFLFLNFYLLGLGRDAAFIGLANAIPSLVTLLFGLPAGLISDRIGPRRGLLFGTAVMAAGLAGTALSAEAWLLVLWICVQGMGSAFLWSNAGPFMMLHSRGAQRSAIFSLEGALGNSMGFVGNLLGGYVPTVLALAFGVGADSVPALRGALWVAVGLTLLSLIPLLRLPDRATVADAPEAAPGAAPAPGHAAPRAGRRLFQRPGLVARLLLPGTLIGVGAGMNMPVLNLFVQHRFGISFDELGLVFALSSLGTTVATLLQPILAARVGRVRSTLLVEAASLPFLIVLGYVPVFSLVVAALVVRAALMNMGNPIFTAFSLEQIGPAERARFSSLSAMLWSGGWAAGSLFSGWWRDLVGIDTGFATTFALMALSYAGSMVLLWWWFDRPEAAARRAARPRPAPAGA